MRTTKKATIDALRRAAADGKTRKQAAKEIGIDYVWVCQLVNRHGIPFKHGLTAPKPKRKRRLGLIGAVKASGVLKHLTLQERYDALTLMRKGGYLAPEALRTIGRADLVPAIEKIHEAQL